MPRKKRTHFVYAKLLESIQPLDRADRYEDPLDEALEQARLGEVTGGGTMQTANGEIEFAGIDLELTNLSTALSLVTTVLNDCGAPVGSQLEYQNDKNCVVLPFGVTEGVAIYLDGLTLPADIYASTDINVLADRINELLQSNDSAGEIRDSWAGPQETAIYLYGRSAERMWSLISPLLHEYPLCQNARVVLRRGGPAPEPSSFRMPFHNPTAKP